MRAPILVLLAATTSAFAQNNSYFLGLLQTLAGSGLNRIVSATQIISNTTTGQRLLADLPNGNKTLFAPNDNAFTQAGNITDPDTLASIISYHVATGWFATFSNAPEHTIARTALNNSKYVMLEGNKSQVLVLSTENCTGRILQQNSTVSVLSTTTYQNLLIHIVDAVINIPPTLSTAISSYNLSALANGTQQSGVIGPLEAAHGITIFAPIDAALNPAIQPIGSNHPLLQNVFNNHIINGTTAYSTQLVPSANYTSAAGEPFRFSNNSNGTLVSSGSSTARIIQSDVLISNGVLHIIDGVLLNTQNNTQAASSAFASATSAATQSITESTGVGATPTSVNVSIISSSVTVTSSGSAAFSSAGGNQSNDDVIVDIGVLKLFAISSLLVFIGGNLIA